MHGKENTFRVLSAEFSSNHAAARTAVGAVVWTGQSETAGFVCTIHATRFPLPQTPKHPRRSAATKPTIEPNKQVGHIFGSQGQGGRGVSRGARAAAAGSAAAGRAVRAPRVLEFSCWACVWCAVRWLSVGELSVMETRSCLSRGCRGWPALLLRSQNGYAS